MMNGESIESKRLIELALRAGHTGQAQFTRFLEPSWHDEARAAANKAGVRVAFWGGWPDAERCLAAFYDGEAPEPADYPIALLRIGWNAKFASPGHRDLLGASMGLGLERETMGDIAMAAWRGSDCAVLFALPEVADYIAANLDSAGRASLKVDPVDELPELKPPEGAELRVTVQNFRLDAVLAAACRLSRSEAQKLILAGLVKLNHVPSLHTDARLDEGDLISARGYGRIKVVAFQGESRRGRQIVTVFRYGK